MSKTYITPSFHEARRYLPQNASDDEIHAFIDRQTEARCRVSLLNTFYRENPCRMSQIHLMTASCVAIARFCGVPKQFNALGARIMPIKGDGTPKTQHWQHYLRRLQSGTTALPSR